MQTIPAASVSARLATVRTLQAKQAAQTADISDLLTIFKSLVSSPFSADEIRAACGKADRLMLVK